MIFASSLPYFFDLFQSSHAPLISPSIFLAKPLLLYASASSGFSSNALLKSTMALSYFSILLYALPLET